MYILFINPTRSPEELAPVFPAHSEFLERHCKAGTFILTGGLTARPAGVVLAAAYLGGDLVYHRGWRVKPVEREEIETHSVPRTVRDDDFLLRRSRSVRLSSAARSQPTA